MQLLFRFLEFSVSEDGPPTGKWDLVDVAHNNTRSSSQRLKEKKERTTHRSERSLTDALHSAQEQVKVLKEQLQAAELKIAARDVKMRATKDKKSVSVCVCVQ